MLVGKKFSFVDDCAVTFFGLTGIRDFNGKDFRIEHHGKSVLIENKASIISGMIYIIDEHYKDNMTAIDSIVISNKLAIYLFFNGWISPKSLVNAWYNPSCPNEYEAVTLLMSTNKETVVTHVVDELVLQGHHDASIFWLEDELKYKPWVFNF